MGAFTNKLCNHQPLNMLLHTWPFLFLVPLFILTLTPTSADGSFCDVFAQYYNNSDVDGYQPLILTENGEEFRYPSIIGGRLKIPEGASIRLACPGRNNSFKNINIKPFVNAKCGARQMFRIAGKSYPYTFRSLGCQTRVSTKTRYTTHCLGKNRTVEIGFQLEGNFVPTIQVCRNDVTYVTYYTKFTLSKDIRYAQIGSPRPWWNPGTFYDGLDMNSVYNVQSNQVRTLAMILGTDANHIRRNYITQGQYLSRGHMAAKGDFIYSAQQNSTFWYINSAPQWASTNGGSWNSVENDVRQLVIDRSLTLDVYTGVHDIMQLPDRNGNLQDIYLTVDPKRAIPVPNIYWKVIYDPVSRKGVAILGLNNPFIRSTPAYLCTDICNNLRWLTCNSRNITAGISYACSFNDARRAISEIPYLNVIGDLV